MMKAYVNGKIYTMNNDEVVEAMVVENTKITKVGNTKEILEYIDEKVENVKNIEVIDLEQRCVLPGFNDSHLHGLLSAQKLVQIDLSQAKSIDDLVNISKEQMPKDLKEGEWIIGRGWNQDYFDVKEFPTKKDLDRISTSNPICLIRACIHICSVNSKALEIINLDKDNLPQLSDGKIYVDENGEPNGVFAESALTYVYDNFPVVEIDDIKKLITTLAKRLNSQGITSIQSDDFTALNNVDYKTIMQAYQELAQDNKLNLKVYQQCLFPKIETFQEFLDAGYRTKDTFNNYRIGPLKLLLDGSLGARTAYLEGTYNDDPHAEGIRAYDEAELYEYGKLAQQNNIQMAIHGIGDGAINQILDMYSKLRINMPRNDHRHGIVHCQITEKKAIDKIIEEKAVIYAQPIFLHYDIQIVDDRVGKEKGSTSYAFKTLMDNGVSVSLGTDSPVEDTNPFDNIYCGVTRKNLNNNMSEGWNMHEALTLKDAIKGYTYEGAFQSFEEDIKGTLEVNKQADFIVLDKDIFNIDIEDIRSINVLKTVVDGRLVYSK